MATYVILGNFTEQGIRAVKDTTRRAEAVRKIGKKIGVAIKDVYWTLGPYDLLIVADAPDDAAVAALSASVCAQGNVRYQTLRAFSVEEVDKILGQMV